MLVAGVKIRRGKFSEVAFEYRDGCFCGSAKSKPEALLAVSTRGLIFPLCLSESRFVCNNKVLKNVASDHTSSKPLAQTRPPLNRAVL